MSAAEKRSAPGSLTARCPVVRPAESAIDSDVSVGATVSAAADVKRTSSVPFATWPASGMKSRAATKRDPRCTDGEGFATFRVSVPLSFTFPAASYIVQYVPNVSANRASPYMPRKTPEPPPVPKNDSG
jgi:hypothetical protein